jgi:hypothetical protein
MVNSGVEEGYETSSMPEKRDGRGADGSEVTRFKLGWPDEVT